jgi:hypothetical protein
MGYVWEKVLGVFSLVLCAGFRPKSVKINTFDVWVYCGVQM